MNDEEFKKKLDRILENLYRIDTEAKEAVEKERSGPKNQTAQEKTTPEKGDLRPAKPPRETIRNIATREPQSL